MPVGEQGRRVWLAETGFEEMKMFSEGDVESFEKDSSKVGISTLLGSGERQCSTLLPLSAPTYCRMDQDE